MKDLRHPAKSLYQKELYQKEDEIIASTEDYHSRIVQLMYYHLIWKLLHRFLTNDTVSAFSLVIILG